MRRPSTDEKNRHAKCPFWKRINYERHSITCEGPIPDSSVSVNFRDMKELNTHMDIFCREHYKNCELFPATMEKYSEEGDE